LLLLLLLLLLLFPHCRARRQSQPNQQQIHQSP
jgi:hypothetical protein